MRRMPRMVRVIVVVAAICSPIVVAAAGNNLTEADRAHLIFMRSEEKLARDVYLAIAEMYPGSPVFASIATQAEQTHTDTMLKMLEKFRVADPEPSTLPDTVPPAEQIGEFENYYFEVYFSEKFELLVGEARIDLLAALSVGALIEELDMRDIRYCNDAFYVYYPEPLPVFPYCGGLSATSVTALENTLGNLLAGSENHLCAFISQIGPLLEGGCYRALVLEQWEVSEIVDRNCPEFIGFVCPEGES